VAEVEIDLAMLLAQTLDQDASGFGGGQVFSHGHLPNVRVTTKKGGRSRPAFKNLAGANQKKPSALGE
jgi:hypothetical protein